MDIIGGFLFIMETEIWKDVVGYEGLYKVSNLGNVFGVKYKRILKQYVPKDFYPSVSLCKNNKKSTVCVHGLVANAFLHKNDNYNKNVVNHIDGNKHNNHILNLEYVSVRANSTICYRKNKETKSSKYSGVSLHKKYNKWLSEIKYKGKKIYVGYFKTEIEAHLAYQNKLKELNITI